MRKRLGLFIIGFVLALGAFFLYKYVTGADLLPQKPVKPPDVMVTPSDRSHTYEFRKRSTGELRYIITAKSADPVKDKDGNPIPGQYKIIEPGATFYTKDGRTMNIRADICNLVLDQLPKGSRAANTTEVELPPFQVRVGTLSGNVLLTISAKPYVSGDPKPMDGELTVAFDGDVEIFQNQNLLTSSGPVHIRSDVMVYDGESLNLSFNRDEQRIEFLRIEKGDTVIVRGVGDKAFSLDGEDVEKRIVRAPEKTPGMPAAAVPAVAPAGAPAAAPPAGTALLPMKPLPNPASAPASQPKGEPHELTSYRLSFGNDVEAKVGARSLKSAQLFVLFQPGKQDLEKSVKPTGETLHAGPNAPLPAATNVAPAVAPLPPSPRRVASRPAPKTAAERHAAARAPYAPAGPDDLVIHWKGPMEMRPSGPDDVQLTGPNDRALEAVGTRENPVVLKDELRTVTAGRLWYHGAADRIEIEPGDLPNVQMADNTQGMLICQGVSVLRGGNARGAMGVALKGPGTIEVPQSVLSRDVSKANREPTRLSWTNKADIEFGSADPKAGGRKAPMVKRATLHGDVAIRDSSYQMLADTLDVAFTNVGSGDSKSSQALEHLLANGKVRIKFARGSGLGVDDASKPEGMTANRLEVFTELRNKVASPSRILATGDVVAWTYSRDERDPSKVLGMAKPPGPGQLVPVAAVDKQPRRLLQQTIFTPKLDIMLEGKEKEKTGAIADSGSPAGLLLGSGNALKSMTASDGVKIEIEGFEDTGKLITATAQTLTADKNGRAVLEGAPGVSQPNGIPKKVQIIQGENQIAGDHVILDQKSQSIEIPGEGMFSFLEPGQKGEPDSTVQVNWTEHMSFDQKTNTALFRGMVETRQVGKANQTSEMTCKERLQVVLHPSRGSGGGAANDNVAGKLKSLLARGDVHVKGVTHDPATRGIVTSIELRTARVQYSAETDVLEIPGPGSLQVEDYRAAKPGGERKKNEGPDSRGITRFVWKESLAYFGQKSADQPGTIRMNGQVVMAHVPTDSQGLLQVKAAKATENRTVRLRAESLVAHLAQSKEAGGSKPVSNPVGFGTGGDIKFAGAKAIGNALLEYGEDSITGNTLEFDSARNVAIARSKPGTDAQVVRPDQAIASAEEILWDLKTNSFKFTKPRGNFMR